MTVYGKLIENPTDSCLLIRLRSPVMQLKGGCHVHNIALPIKTCLDPVHGRCREAGSATLGSRVDCWGFISVDGHCG